MLVELIYSLPLAVTVDIREGHVVSVEELGDLINYPGKEAVLIDEDGTRRSAGAEKLLRAFNVAESVDWPARQ